MSDPVTPIVELDDVSKRYPTHPDAPPALDDVSLRIDRGEIFGVIGESGAGKSTLLRLINGLERPSSGTVRVLGQRVPELGRGELQRFRRDIGVLFQGVHLLSNRTVRGNVLLPLQLRRTRWAEALSASIREGERAGADSMLDFVGLAHRADDYPAQLSGGQQQRVGIARALAGNPPLLLCDEPTSSLDSSTTDEVLRVLLDARDRLGTTVLVVTHDLGVVRAVCDRAALFESGRLREVLTVHKRPYRSHPSYAEQAKRELSA